MNCTLCQIIVMSKNICFTLNPLTRDCITILPEQETCNHKHNFCHHQAVKQVNDLLTPSSLTCHCLFPLLLTYAVCNLFKKLCLFAFCQQVEVNCNVFLDSPISVASRFLVCLPLFLKIRVFQDGNM